MKNEQTADNVRFLTVWYGKDPYEYWQYLHDIQFSQAFYDYCRTKVQLSDYIRHQYFTRFFCNVNTPLRRFLTQGTSKQKGLKSKK